MFAECSCKALHHLSSVACHELTDMSLSRAQNMTEFSGNRSSDAFRTTALVKQGLSTDKGSCFDLVEDAVTAMVKGHLLRPRRMAHPNIPVEGMPLPRHESQDDVAFGQLWNYEDYKVESLTMSTLRMFDLSQEKQEPQTSVPTTRTVPQDWESYIDEKQEERHQSA